MNRATAILSVLIALAVPLSLLAGRVWIDPATTPNAALIVMEVNTAPVRNMMIPGSEAIKPFVWTAWPLK